MQIDIAPGMEEIFSEFILEANEILESLDQNLVSLEEYPDDKELLNEIFREIHTLKGGAGFLGLYSIIEVAHKIEDLFFKLRDDQLQLNTEMMDAILEGVDALKSGIAMAQERQEIPDIESVEPLVKRLDAFLHSSDAGTIESPSETAPSTRTFKPDTDPDIKAVIERYPDKSFDDILEEIIFLPPEERDMALVDKIEKVVSEGKEVEDFFETPEAVSTSASEEADKSADAVNVTGEADETLKKAEAAETAPAAKPAEQKKPAETAAKKEQPKKMAAEETIRINADQLDMVMDLVGELVLDRNRIVKLASKLANALPHDESMEAFNESISGMNRTVGDLQDAVMKMRIQPVEKIFAKFPRVVRSLAGKLGKKVKLDLVGEKTEIGRTILNQLEDPMIHLVRNAIDHGIETPDVRRAAGKPETGHITISAAQEGDRIVITISDDGKGIDANVIKQKAIEKGLIRPEQADMMSDREAFELILLPGFSTAEQISDISGRGVGMDVVASSIQSLRGTIEIDSVYGEGSTITMKLPLTIAIIRTLMVGVNGNTFALPLHSVSEIITYDPSMIKTVGTQRSLMLRDDVYLLVGLNDLFDMPEEGEKRFIIIINLGERDIAVAIDDLFGEEEIVIKSLGELLGNIQGLAGATITGDGRVVTILDIPSLINRKKLQYLNEGAAQ
jgi:two-component system chemotaxis sensor kinase CheA